MRNKENLNSMMDEKMRLLQEKLNAEKIDQDNKKYEAEKKYYAQEKNIMFEYNKDLTEKCRLYVDNITSLKDFQRDHKAKALATLNSFLQEILLDESVYTFKVRDGFIDETKNKCVNKLSTKIEDNEKLLLSIFRVEEAQRENIKTKAENRCREIAEMCLTKYKSKIFETLDAKAKNDKQIDEKILDDFKNQTVSEFKEKTKNNSIEVPNFKFKVSKINITSTIVEIGVKLNSDIDQHCAYFINKTNKNKQKYLKMYQAQSSYDNNVEMSVKEYQQKMTGRFKSISTKKELEDASKLEKNEALEYFATLNEKFHLNLKVFSDCSDNLSEEYKTFEAQRKSRLFEIIENKHLAYEKQINLELVECEKIECEIRLFYSDKLDNLHTNYECAMNKIIKSFKHEKIWRFFTLGLSSERESQKMKVSDHHQEKKKEVLDQLLSKSYGVSEKTKHFWFGVGASIISFENEVRKKESSNLEDRINYTWKIELYKKWEYKNGVLW